VNPPRPYLAGQSSSALARLCGLVGVLQLSACLTPPPLNPGNDNAGASTQATALAPHALEKMTEQDAWTAAGLMSPGINIGNTLENTTTWETGWGQPPITKEYVASLARLGFKSVRLPVAWDTYAADGRIQPDKLARVSEVVDWITGAGMYCIVNIHWDGGWIDSDAKDKFPTTFDTFSAEAEKKFRSYWEQISTFFAGKNEKLLLEALNEETNFSREGSTAKAYATLTRVNQIFIDTVRKSGGNNAKRLLIVAGYSTDIAKTCASTYQLPKDTLPGRLFISVHYYTPYQFCGLTEDADWGKMMRTWGSPDDVKQLLQLFDQMQGFCTRNDIPAYIGEFGVATKNKDPDARVRWMSAVASAALARRMVPVLWDTGGDVSRNDPYSPSPELAQTLKSLGPPAPAPARPTSPAAPPAAPPTAATATSSTAAPATPPTAVVPTTLAVHPLFSDHAVLQQGTQVPIWGWAPPGETVTVEIAHQKVSTTAGADGKWLVHLAPLKAGGPFTLTIAGQGPSDARVVLNDILVGEVWVASGQSNMERQLGLRVGQQPIFEWEKEVAAAKHPQIRHFGVAQEKSLTALDTIKGNWSVCSPETVKDFTAVGYFFARDLQRARHVPIGVIHSSWGGTVAEAWTSTAGLRPLPDFADTAEQIKTLIADPEAALRNYQAKLEDWFIHHDAGSVAGKSWSDPALDTESWKTMPVPGLWEEAGEPDLNGVVWLRKTFELPDSATDAAAELQLGMVDDIDTTFVNGVNIGGTVGYNLVRKYPVAAGVLKPGRNVVAVRVLDTGGGGGIWGEEKPRLVLKGKVASPPIELGGPWRYRVGMNLQDGPMPPTGYIGDVNTPTILYNAMIAPLLPYAIAGVVWYQGESNVHREQQYRSLLPALIGDWRHAWGWDFPFLFVQIAPHHDMTPELRDAQLATWQHTPKTAMAVITDCGDANDIHPTHKQPVGTRLALAARALAYGEKVEYSGPVFESLEVSGDAAALRFTHLGGGLVAKGGPLKGFTIAGADGVFLSARARIRGNTVVVTSDAISQPVAVRYGWTNVPDGNLFNKAGLPASPFRTDSSDAK